MARDKFRSDPSIGGSFHDRFMYNQRVSYSKKKANDFEWVERMADYYDFYYNNHYRDDERIKNMKLNYALYNGRGEDAFKSYQPGWGTDVVSELGFDGGFEHVQHFDIISHIAKAMVGEQRKRPLKPVVVDTSGYALNNRKRKHLELLQGYLSEQYIAPIQEQVTQQYLQEMGITDIYSLEPEQQQQMQQEIGQRTQQMTPKEIHEYMRKDYKAPSERQAQRLMDYLLKELDIKFITDENFKHLVIAGEEIYHIGERHDEPTLKICNPIGFTWSGADNVQFYEEGEWCKYEEMIKFSQFFDEVGDQLTEAQLKKLESITEGNASSENFSSQMESRLVSVIDRNPGMMDGIDIRNRDGQDFTKEIYSKFGSQNLAKSDIRKVHFNFKSLRKLKNIRRMDEQGKIDSFWVDESYTFNPLKGDIEEKTAWVPEVWEVTKYGTIDAIYMNKRPVPSQYKSLTNPWGVKLSYYGTQASRLMSNTKNASPIDLGKPWQYKFNVQMARLHEIEATDLGKVLLTTFNSLPEGWTWDKFLMMMKYSKLAVVNSMAEGINVNDLQAIRQLDLSTIADLSSRLQYLEWLRNQVSTAMSYNPSRLGDSSPYTAVTNNQQSIIQSTHQTEDFYSLHNKVVERVLNALLNTSRYAYKNNEFKKSYILDDMSVAELDIDSELLWRSEIGVFVSNSSEDFENIQIVKQQAQSMIQNGLISFPELIKLQWSKNYGDVLNISEQAEQRQQEQMEAQQQAQQKQIEDQMKMEAQMLQMQQEFELLKQSNELRSKLDLATIQSMQFANQYDIDKDGVNDGIQKAELDNKNKIELEGMKQKTEEKKLKLEKERMLIEKQLKEKEIEVKKIQARKPTSKK